LLLRAVMGMALLAQGVLMLLVWRAPDFDIRAIAFLAIISGGFFLAGYLVSITRAVAAGLVTLCHFVTANSPTITA
jgi:hypothetical protein